MRKKHKSRGCGKSAGEKKMGKMDHQLKAKRYPHSPSKSGNGGKNG